MASVAGALATFHSLGARLLGDGLVGNGVVGKHQTPVPERSHRH